MKYVGQLLDDGWRTPCLLIQALGGGGPLSSARPPECCGKLVSGNAPLNGVFCPVETHRGTFQLLLFCLRRSFFDTPRLIIRPIQQDLALRIVRFKLS